MAAHQKCVDFVDEQLIFEANAFLLIEEMYAMETETEEDTSDLVDELLHAIFFLGRVTFPSFVPDSIFNGHSELLQDLMDTYPGPFGQYSSQVPRRSPFSCVLDMIVHQVGQENEEQIKDRLHELSKELMENDHSKILKSTTVCVSCASSVRYYGVSMSTHRKPARHIIIAASCLEFWDEYVADAVMTYYPQKKKKKKFDGTIRLPEGVRCEAFNIKEKEKMDPCLACRNMFSLHAEKQNGKDKFPYGNCAEAESLSKLLKSEDVVRGQVQRPATWIEQDRQRVIHDVRIHLKNVLKANEHFQWDNQHIPFYSPQSATPENEEDDEFLFE